MIQGITRSWFTRGLIYFNLNVYSFETFLMFIWILWNTFKYISFVTKGNYSHPSSVCYIKAMSLLEQQQKTVAWTISKLCNIY